MRSLSKLTKRLSVNLSRPAAICSQRLQYIGRHNGSNQPFSKDATLQSFLEGNKGWREQFGAYFSNNEDNVLNTQIPLATLVSCCDSRAPPDSFNTHNANVIFGIRNIGNQVLNAHGSIMYGVAALKSPFAVVMGHTGCGAIKAASSDYTGLHTAIQKELLPLLPSIQFANSVATNLDQKSTEARLDIYSEINVDCQVTRLLHDSTIGERVKTGDLTLIGAMFDIHNVYGLGHGKFVIVNINGEHDLESLKKNDSLSKLSSDQRSDAVARLVDYPNNQQLNVK